MAPASGLADLRTVAGRMDHIAWIYYYFGGKPEIQQTDQTERTQVSCYAVMQVLYVSSMQWPTALRLMRGI